MGLPDSPCACCGSAATALVFDPDTEQHVCADRELCRQAMIFENLLARGESS